MSDEPTAYIQFETRAAEDRAATHAKGHYVAKDVDFAIIIPPGDGKTVLEQEVTEKHRILYKTQYEAFKQGKEMPVNGTPIKSWPGISPAMAENLIRANVRTIEDLANCAESTLERIGMGSRPLKHKAMEYLKASESPGKVSEQISALTTRVDAMAASDIEKDNLIAELQAELKAATKPVSRGSHEEVPTGQGNDQEEEDFVYGEDDDEGEEFEEEEMETKPPPAPVAKPAKSRKPGKAKKETSKKRKTKKE